MTDNIHDNMDDLLVKVMLQEASEAELRQVEGWVAQSDGNRRYFADFRQIWEQSRNLSLRSRMSEDNAWKDFRKRISSPVADRSAAAFIEAEGPGLSGTPGGPGGSAEMRERAEGDGFGTEEELQDPGVVPMRARRLSWLRVAAAILVIVAGGWFFYNRSSDRSAQLLSIRTENQPMTDTLPEGSVVTLNRQSAIQYKRSFAGATRRVDLEGEAFFSVAQDKNKPFIVRAGGASITVLGTSFNVRMTGNGTEVIVESGMVEVANGDRKVRVGAHEKALIGAGGVGLVTKANTDNLYNYYRTHEFECDGTPLRRVVEKINEVYGAHITVADSSLQDLPLTVTFQHESLDKILFVISRTLGIRVTRNGEETILQK